MKCPYCKEEIEEEKEIISGNIYHSCKKGRNYKIINNLNESHESKI